MRSIDDAHKLVKGYKETLIGDRTVPFRTAADKDVCNGVEIALAIIENRPAFLLDINKQYTREDMINHPDYFI